MYKYEIGQTLLRTRWFQLEEKGEGREFNDSVTPEKLGRGVVMENIIAVIISIIATAGSVYAVIISENRKRELDLQRRYATPLLKSAEDLYNKINDLVKNRKNTVEYLSHLGAEIENIQTVETAFSKPYVTHVLYLLARYFASVEAIKKDLGLFQVASKKKTKALQYRLRQTIAVFFSGRLFKGFHLNQIDRVKYRGLIFEGSQVLIGEAMLKVVKGTQQCISFYEFCEKLSDTTFRRCLEPLLKFLNGLTPDQIDNTVDEDFQPIDFQNTPEIDFRWPKLIVFAWYLKKLVEQIDTKKIVVLLPELEKYSEKYFHRHTELHSNIEEFEEAFPALKLTLTSFCKKFGVACPIKSKTSRRQR